MPGNQPYIYYIISKKSGRRIFFFFLRADEYGRLGTFWLRLLIIIMTNYWRVRILKNENEQPRYLTFLHLRYLRYWTRANKIQTSWKLTLPNKDKKNSFSQIKTKGPKRKTLLLFQLHVLFGIWLWHICWMTNPQQRLRLDHLLWWLDFLQEHWQISHKPLNKQVWLELKSFKRNTSRQVCEWVISSP